MVCISREVIWGKDYVKRFVGLRRSGFKHDYAGRMLQNGVLSY